MIRVRQKYIIQTKKKCFVVSLWLLPMVSILANFGDFRDFRDFRLSDTSFLIENGLFFLIREIPKFFSNLFYTQSTPRFQSSIRNFQNQPCMTPPIYGLTQFFILLFLKCQPVAFVPNFSFWNIYANLRFFLQPLIPSFTYFL